MTLTRLQIVKLVDGFVKDASKPVEDCRAVLLFLVGKLAAPLSMERDIAALALNQLLKVSISLVVLNTNV